MTVGERHHLFKDLTGYRVGFLTAQFYAGRAKGLSVWKVRCDCGTEKYITAGEFLRKRGAETRSCGCKTRRLMSTARTSHGMSKHPAFAVWRSMIDRCRLPSHQSWENYGARGIRVCERWQQSFENFWSDMGAEYAHGLTLDRIDNDGGYCPENCRWTTMKEQANNRRNSVRVDGMTVAEIAAKAGISRSAVYYRISRGVKGAAMLTPADVTREFMTS